MTSRVEFSDRAEADLEEIADHIAQDSPRRAVSFTRELRARCERITEQPRANRLREDFGPGVRGAAHGSYIILYAERQGVLVIERLVHGARDLGRLPDDRGSARGRAPLRPARRGRSTNAPRVTPSPAPPAPPHSRP